MEQNAKSRIVDELYGQLVECLESLVKGYRSLLEVVRKEKEILVSAKLDDLNENNKSKDALLVRVRSFETSRMKCARDLAQAVGADVEAPRLLDIALRFDTERSDKLRNLHSVLDLLLRRLSEVNKSNEALAQSALQNITGAMDSIRETFQEKPTYARKGVMTGKNEGGHLVSKEA